MTVKKLFDHIHFLPDRISYFDKTNNVEDVIKIFVRVEDKIRYNIDYKIRYTDYYDFIDKYGDREVTDWNLWFDGGFSVEVGFK